MLLTIATPAMSATFSEIIESIVSHQKIKSLQNRSYALKAESRSKGSWGDPMFKLSLKNIPKETLSADETPMSGKEIAVSQVVPLTSRLGDQEDALRYMSQSKNWEALLTRDNLIQQFWQYLITDRRLREELTILRENLIWISKMISVSRNLYATGKQSQQALLELEIRKSELKSDIRSKELAIEIEKSTLLYLLNGVDHGDVAKVPWSLLEKETKDIDKKEKMLEAAVVASNYLHTAKNKARIPDITFSLGYTKREFDDNLGDFVSFGASIPIPSSDRRYADIVMTAYNKTSMENSLNDYRNQKRSKLHSLQKRSEQLKEELSILAKETIKYAENAMQITTKSYQLGESTYIELLQLELKLQVLKIKQVGLNANLLATKLQIKTLQGEKLYE